MTTLQWSVRRTPWPSYAAAAWCVIFGGLHLDWVLGGTAGFVEFGLPSNRMLALMRDPLYIAMAWGVVLACILGVILALAPFRKWSRHIPRWLLLAPLCIAAGILLLRGLGNLVQTALILRGVIPFAPLSGPDAQAWLEWMHIDSVLFSPWFILGGLAFGATAVVARRK